MDHSSAHRPSDGAVVVYRELARELRDAILAGEFSDERRLPTEAELVAERGVSRQTVRQAYAQLVAENLVYRVRGRGTFTATGSRHGSYLRSFGTIDDLLALSVDTELEVIRPLELGADVVAAGRLQLSSDDVMAATFRRLHEGVVFSVTTVYLPVEVGKGISAAALLSSVGFHSRETVIDLIERNTSVSIVGAHQSINAVRLPADLSSSLECEAGEPVLRIDRIYFDRNGTNVELAVSHFNPLRYSYRLEMRRG
jgi:DNA-binding GntR family transcriptional regulator